MIVFQQQPILALSLIVDIRFIRGYLQKQRSLDKRLNFSRILDKVCV